MGNILQVIHTIENELQYPKENDSWDCPVLVISHSRTLNPFGKHLAQKGKIESTVNIGMMPRLVVPVVTTIQTVSEYLRYG